MVNLRYMILSIIIVQAARHPSPWDELHQLSLIQTYSNANTEHEEKYGHFSLQDALTHSLSDCTDLQYSQWVRLELAEWSTLLHKTVIQLNVDITKVLKVQQDLETSCVDIASNPKYRGNQNIDALDQSSVYTYEKSCIFELIKNVDPDTLFKDPRMCHHILKQVDNLLEQLKWFVTKVDTDFVNWAEIIDGRQKTVCCHSTCHHCDGNGEDDCTRCEQNSNRIIVDEQFCRCKEGYFEINQEQQCQQCEKKCKTCSNTDNCIVCNIPRIGTECLCPAKHFDNEDQVCTPCHYSCNGCVGSLRNMCVEAAGCPTNRTYSNGECLPIEGHYDEEGTPEGKKCHYSCQNCLQPIDGQPLRDSCTNCEGEDKRIFQIVAQVQSISVGKCACKKEPGFGYDIEGQSRCEECNPSCKYCIGNGFEDCTECPEFKHKVHVEGDKYQCIPDEGYYCHHCQTDVTEPLELPEPGQKCDISCKTCNGQGPNKCLTCKTDMTYQNNSCKCSTGYFDTEQKKCNPCHPTCQTCQGEERNECLEPCFELRVFDNGFCKPVPGYFENNLPTPEKCMDQCETCENKENCLTCKGDKRYVKDGQCPCMDGYKKYSLDYIQQKKFDCIPCAQFMIKCDDGPGSEKKCEGGRQVMMVDEEEKCVCPSGNFEHQNDIQCQNCSLQCNACEKESVCTTCKEGLNVFEGACVCEALQYYDQISKICNNCHQACLTCLGGTQSANCVTPVDPNHLPIIRKNIHYLFIVESNQFMNKNYRVTDINVFKAYDTKFELIQFFLQNFIINKIREEKETQVYSDITLMIFNAVATTLIDKKDFNKATISLLPENPSESTVSELNTALLKTIEILNAIDGNDDQYVITIIIDGDSPLTVEQANTFNASLNNKVIQVQVLSLQSDNDSTPQLLVQQIPIVPAAAVNFESELELIGAFNNINKQPITKTPECKPGYFLDTDKLETEKIYCLPCNELCTACNSQTECTKCQDENIRELEAGNCVCPNTMDDINNTCITKCQEDQYRETQSLECKDCDDACKKCTGSTAQNCSDCQAKQYLDNKECKECKNECKACTSLDICTECENGQNNDYKRILKNDKCVCEDNYVANVDITNLQCNKICQENYFLEDPLNCSMCFVTCKTCSGENKDNCLSCKEGLNRQLEGTICNPQPGYFEEGGDPIAKKCDDNCKTCLNSATHCLSCHSDDFVLEENMCKCKTNYFSVTSTDPDSCQKCNDTCQSCLGAGEDKCTSCSENRHAVEQAVDQTHKCQCNDNFTEVNKECKECHFTCKTCSIPQDDTKCTDCQTHRKKDVNSKCVPEEGFFENNKPVPDQCHKRCKTCLNSNQIDNCVLCDIDNKYIRQNSESLTSECIAKPGYFRPPTEEDPAEKCNKTCAECIDNAQKCTACNEKRLLDQEAHKCNCKESFFDNTTTQICEPCHVTCKKCSGVLESDCSTCELPKIIATVDEGKKCLCPTNQYNEENICKDCPFKCQTCQNLEKCFTCFENREGDTCEPLPNYYETGTPIPGRCHYSCKTCNGNTKDHCLTCESTYNRIKMATSCPPKTGYYDAGVAPAVKCDNACATCTGQSDTQCIKCAPLYEKVRQTDDAEKCLPIDGYYEDDDEKVQPCHKSCKACSNGFINSCTKCRINSHLLSGQCVADDGYYVDETDDYKIKKCDDNCLKCETTAKHCIDCRVDMIVSTQNTCICQLGFYLEESICKTCNEKCTSCESLDKCIQCKGNNTEGETCQCKEGSVPQENSLNCTDMFPGGSIQIVVPGIIFGENTDGSIQVGDEKPEGQDDICVKTVMVIEGDHTGEPGEEETVENVANSNASVKPSF